MSRERVKQVVKELVDLVLQYDVDTLCEKMCPDDETVSDCKKLAELVKRGLESEMSLYSFIVVMLNGMIIDELTERLRPRRGDLIRAHLAIAFAHAYTIVHDLYETGAPPDVIEMLTHAARLIRDVSAIVKRAMEEAQRRDHELPRYM